MSYGEIGEGVNTADCGSVMQGFESLISPQNEKKSKDFKIEIDGSLSNSVGNNKFDK